MRILNIAVIALGLAGALHASFAADTRDVVNQTYNLGRTLQYYGPQMSDSQVAQIRDLLDRATQIANSPTQADPNERLDCYNKAYTVLNRDQSLAVCGPSSNAYTGDCVVNAYKTLNAAQTIQVCSNYPNAETAACVTQAYTVLNAAKTVELCQNGGTTRLSSCVVEAYRTMTADQAVAFCKPN